MPVTSLFPDSPEVLSSLQTGAFCARTIRSMRAEVRNQTGWLLPRVAPGSQARGGSA